MSEKPTAHTGPVTGVPDASKKGGKRDGLGDRPPLEIVLKAGLTQSVILALRILADAIMEDHPVTSNPAANLARWTQDGAIKPLGLVAAVIAIVDEAGIAPSQLQLLADRYEQALVRPQHWTTVDHN